MLYLFDEFELDDDLFEIRRNGVKLPVSPKVFDTVALLIRNRHRVVTKAELITCVWRGSSVTEDAIVQAIRKARRLLFGASEPPIETVRGRGYRFTLQVKPIVTARRTAAAE